MMIARAGQFGTLRFRQLGPDEFREPGRAGRLDRLDRRRSARRLARREGGPAHCDDLDRILRLNRLQRVAGIDRPHEGIGRNDRADVGNLHHVEQCRDPRHQILARGRRRCQQVRVTSGELDERAVPHSRQAHGRRPHRRRAAPCEPRRCAAAASATPRQSLPATRMSTSSPAISLAAARALRVAGLSVRLSCSATTRAAIRSPAPRS